MAKQIKVAEPKISKEKWYVRSAKWAAPKLLKLADRVAQAVAVVFVLGTSFLFVRDWLQSNQVNHDFSLVGGILVMSVAIYLIVRKR